MIVDKNIDAYSDGGDPQDPTTSMTYGTWHEPPLNSGANMLAVSYQLSGTAITDLEAEVQVSPDDGTTNRGPVPAINSVSGGNVDIDDAIFVLPIEATGPHIFEVPIRPGMAFRVGFKRTGGDGTSKVVALAELFRV